MRRISEPTRSLNDKQRYLLARIPSRHQLSGYPAPPEPNDVRAARLKIERYDRNLSKLRCKYDKRNEALIQKAREAVYFCPEEKALAIVRQIEKLLKGCEI